MVWWCGGVDATGAKDPKSRSVQEYRYDFTASEALRQRKQYPRVTDDFFARLESILSRGCLYSPRSGTCDQRHHCLTLNQRAAPGMEAFDLKYMMGRLISIFSTTMCTGQGENYRLSIPRVAVQTQPRHANGRAPGIHIPTPSSEYSS